MSDDLFSPRETHRQPADRFERIGELGFVRLDEGGRNDRAGDDDIAGAQPLAMSRERAGQMHHDADHLADELLYIVLLRRQCAATEDMSVQTVELRTGARGIGRAEDDVAVKNVAGK